MRYGDMIGGPLLLESAPTGLRPAIAPGFSAVGSGHRCRERFLLGSSSEPSVVSIARIWSLAVNVQLPEDARGRLGRAGQRGRIGPRDGLRLAGPDRRHRVLGLPAQAEPQGRDAVTDGRAGDPGPDRVDGARGLEAEHGVRGQRNALEIAGPQSQVGRADPGCLDLDPDPPLTQAGQRDPGPAHGRRALQFPVPPKNWII